ALEIGFLPGVTDNVGHTATELLHLSRQHPAPVAGFMDLGLRRDAAEENVYSSKLYLLKGKLKHEDVQSLATQIANSLINRITIKDAKSFAKDGGMDAVIPKVSLSNQGSAADDINLNINDEELEK